MPFIMGKRLRSSLRVFGDQVEIGIRDHGPGLRELDHERLFKPYTRLEHGKNMNSGGMGLGLDIAQSIIHGHGGDLHLANHPEGGLVVTLQLPLIYAVV